jgi:hypothetical protein
MIAPLQNPVHKLQLKRFLNKGKRVKKDLGVSRIDPYRTIHISPTEARDSNSNFQLELLMLFRGASESFSFSSIKASLILSSSSSLRFTTPPKSSFSVNRSLPGFCVKVGQAFLPQHNMTVLFFILVFLYFRKYFIHSFGVGKFILQLNPLLIPIFTLRNS